MSVRMSASVTALLVFCFTAVAACMALDYPALPIAAVLWQSAKVLVVIMCIAAVGGAVASALLRRW